MPIGGSQYTYFQFIKYLNRVYIPYYSRYNNYNIKLWKANNFHNVVPLWRAKGMDIKMKVLSIVSKIITIAIYLIFIFNMIELNVLHILFVAIFLLVTDIIHAIIHEIGHLIGGKLSSYHFLMLHIGPFKLFRKKESKGSFSFSFDKDIYSQCVMIPEINNHYLLFNISGILINFLSVVIFSVILILNLKELNFIFSIFLSFNKALTLPLSTVLP